MEASTSLLAYNIPKSKIPFITEMNQSVGVSAATAS